MVSRNTISSLRKSAAMAPTLSTISMAQRIQKTLMKTKRPRQYSTFAYLDYLVAQGRIQTEAEAKGIDQLTKEILNEFGVPFRPVDYLTAEEIIVGDVKHYLEKGWV